MQTAVEGQAVSVCPMQISLASEPVAAEIGACSDNGKDEEVCPSRGAEEACAHAERLGVEAARLNVLAAQAAGNAAQATAAAADVARTAATLIRYERRTSLLQWGKASRLLDRIDRNVALYDIDGDGFHGVGGGAVARASLSYNKKGGVGNEISPCDGLG